MTSRGGSPNSLVVRQALLECERQFGVIGGGQVRYGQLEDDKTDTNV